MSFKSVQAKIAGRSGVGMKRAGAMLASKTRKTMQAHGMSTKHGIPKNVFRKKAFKKKVNMPGMSKHEMVNCNQQMRNNKTMPMMGMMKNGMSDKKMDKGMKKKSAGKGMEM